MQQYQPSPSSSVVRYRHQHASDYISSYSSPPSSSNSAYSSNASDWHSASRHSQPSYSSSTASSYSTASDWGSASTSSQPPYTNSTASRYRNNQLPSPSANSTTSSDWRSVSTCSQPSPVTVFTSSRDGFRAGGDVSVNVNVHVRFNWDMSFTMPSNSSMAVSAGKAVVGKGIEALGNAPDLAGPALAVGIEFGHCGYDLYKLNNERKSGRITERNFRVSATERVSEAAVGGSLALGGSIVGGAIGSCVPGIGTAVGGFVGNVIGSAAGLIAGKILGSSLGNWLGERMW